MFPASKIRNIIEKRVVLVENLCMTKKMYE